MAPTKIPTLTAKRPDPLGCVPDAAGVELVPATTGLVVAELELPELPSEEPPEPDTPLLVPFFPLHSCKSVVRAVVEMFVFVL
jgi:hypothetical protein